VEETIQKPALAIDAAHTAAPRRPDPSMTPAIGSAWRMTPAEVRARLRARAERPEATAPPRQPDD
jgi:hypothetical protein